MIANNVPPPHAAPTNAGASQQDNETLEANEEAMLLRRLDILAIYTKANDHEAFNRVVDDIIKQFGRELFSRLWLHMLRDEARREVARILATAPRLPEPSQVCTDKDLDAWVRSSWVDLAAKKKKKKCIKVMLKDLSDNKQTWANVSSTAEAPPTWRKDTAATLLSTWLA